MSETLSVPRRPGVPLAQAGGLPPIRSNILEAAKPRMVVTPNKPAAVQLMAEPPATPAKANLDYLNAVGSVSPSLAAILRPQAAYRWLLPYLAAITPQYVEGILRGALAGNHVQAWELFDLMIDSNPEIAACIGEYVDGVLERKIIVDPYRSGEELPTPKAVRNQKMVQAALFGMNPDPANDENEIEDTVRDILFGRFHNQSLLEEDWYDTYGTGQLNRINVDGVGSIAAPRCTFWVHPVCYAWDMSGRLGLRVALTDQLADISRTAKNQKPGQRGSGMVEPPAWNFISSQPLPSTLTDFPKNKFLISIFKAKAGTALSASCLRSLAAWWVFENFSADYAMDLAQIFGIPFRTATFSSNTSEPDKEFVREMLQNMGSRGWAMLPEGVTLAFEKAMATGAESPQGFLIKLCHEQYRKVILRQTMTGSGHGGASSGSKAGMGVETDVKEQCVNAGAKHVCKVLRNQFARHVLKVNLGSDDELPLIRMLAEEEGDYSDMQRDQIGATLVDMGEDYIRKKYNYPKPVAGEKIVGQTTGTLAVAAAAQAQSQAQPAPEPGEGDDDPGSDDPPDNASELNAGDVAALENKKSKLVSDYAAALAATLSPLVKYLKAGLELPEDAQRHYFQRAIEQWPKLTKPLQADSSSAEKLTPELVNNFIDGLTAKKKI